VKILRPLKREDGQAMTEFALVMPIFAVLLLAIIQFGIAFNNYLTLTDATRTGARTAAVSRFVGDNGASAAAAVRTAAQSLDQSQLGVAVSATSWTTPGSDVSVATTYPWSVSILGWIVTSGTLTSTTKERLE
jgi:Flp pilus assembly protein TadG